MDCSDWQSHASRTTASTWPEETQKPGHHLFSIPGLCPEVEKSHQRMGRDAHGQADCRLLQGYWPARLVSASENHHVYRLRCLIHIAVFGMRSLVESITLGRDVSSGARSHYSPDLKKNYPKTLLFTLI